MTKEVSLNSRWAGSRGELDALVLYRINALVLSYGLSRYEELAARYCEL